MFFSHMVIYHNPDGQKIKNGLYHETLPLARVYRARIHYTNTNNNKYIFPFFSTSHMLEG